jgi:hypothetical protein
VSINVLLQIGIIPLVLQSPRLKSEICKTRDICKTRNERFFPIPRIRLVLPTMNPQRPNNIRKRRTYAKSDIDKE